VFASSLRVVAGVAGRGLVGKEGEVGRCCCCCPTGACCAYFCASFLFDAESSMRRNKEDFNAVDSREVYLGWLPRQAQGARRKANQSSRVGVVCFLNLPETQEYRSGGLQMLFLSSGSLEFGSPVTRQTRRHGRTVDGMDVVVVKAGVCGRNTRQLGTQLNPGRGPPRSPEHRVLGTYAWADSG